MLFAVMRNGWVVTVSMRILYALAAGLAIALLGYAFFWDANKLRDQSSSIVNPKTLTESEQNQIVPPSDSRGGDSQVAQSPKELVRSIYDYDLSYRQQAEAAAESMISYFDPKSYLRWTPVRLEPNSILQGDYLREGAMPQVVRVSPFPDVTYTATQTEYTIREFIDSAKWKGAIVGTDSGRIEITIVGGSRNPTMSIRIIDVPQSFGITPTDVPNTYVAIEANPNQPPWKD